MTLARRRLQAAAVDLDFVGVRIGFRPEFSDHAAVQLNPALGNEAIGGPAGGDAVHRQKFVEANRHIANLQLNVEL